MLSLSIGTNERGLDIIKGVIKVNILGAIMRQSQPGIYLKANGLKLKDVFKRKSGGNPESLRRDLLP